MPEISEIFVCTRCGYCCQGQTTVSLDLKDQQRMVNALGLSLEEVKKTYWRVTDEQIQMKTRDGHCIFYDQGCSVHKGRPWRCRQWPLHPSILADENNFQAIASSCPGIRKKVGYEKFCSILRELLRSGQVDS